jgi:cytochrome P450
LTCLSKYNKASRGREIWAKQEDHTRHDGIFRSPWVEPRRSRVGNYCPAVRFTARSILKICQLIAFPTSIAGSDTTATAIRSTFLYIITNPRVLSRLRAETSSALLSSPITDAEARKLPYLQAIIKEGLRIWPPIAALLSKEVPAGGDVLNGIFVPAGTRIGWCAWGLFRNKKIFGEDADTFRPERWLEGSADEIKEMEDTLGLVFSYGKHACLGKNVALMELNKVFVEASLLNIRGAL